MPAALLFATHVRAGEGRIEINGPTQIIESGSYVLTGDIDVDPADIAGIWVRAPGVTIDMNGFAIRGPISCTGSGSDVSCDASDGPTGILASEPGVIVRNGSIIGFRTGMVAIGEVLVKHVAIRESAGTGLALNAPSLVSDSIAQQNLVAGIGGDRDVLIVGCTSRGNGVHGFSSESDQSGAILESVAEGNGSQGIRLSRGLISGVTSSENQTGVVLNGSVLLIDSSASDNAQEQATITSHSAVTRTVFTSGAGTLVQGTTKLGQNLCDGGACP